jgi:pimeloyl-ACP methyl ester carboxylesterase
MHTETQVFSLHFLEEGNGRPLLLIHGFPFNARMWQPQLGQLGGNVRMLAPDLPGFGDSPAMQGTGSVRAYAEDCAALLDAQDILEPVVVAGLSMGGYIAMAFARHFPERVGALVLASTRAGTDSEEGQANRDKTIEKLRAQGVSVLVDEMHPKLLAPQTYIEKPEVAENLKQIMLASTTEGAVGALEAMRDRPDSTELLSKLKMPILIVHGEEDRVIPPSEAQSMAAAIPVVQMEIIAGAGHLPNMEQPEQFNRILGDFLGKI